TLLDRNKLGYVYEAIDYLGSLMDLAILRSLGDRVGEHLRRIQRLSLTGTDVVDDDLLNRTFRTSRLQFLRISLRPIPGMTERAAPRGGACRRRPQPARSGPTADGPFFALSHREAMSQHLRASFAPRLTTTPST